MAPHKRPSKRKKTKGSWAIGFLALAVAAGVILSWGKTQNERTQEFRVRGNWSLSQLDSALNQGLGYRPLIPFSWFAERLGYAQPKACRLLIKSGSRWWNLLQDLRASRGQTSNWVLHAGWHRAQISQSLARIIDADSSELDALFQNNSCMDPWGIDAHSWPVIFIPNTYNLSASSTAYDLLERMKRESEVWWTEERLEKAKLQGLSPQEVVTLASIVTKESNQVDEFETIAGVYINRLRIGMKLQADPTINFARGKIARVRGDALSIESPFNTYKYEGLPPGPICTANPKAIDAVLRYTEHAYLYFCAKTDGSHRHHFSQNFEEHKRYARAFNRMMNERERASN